jgi:hypothetical protein
MFAIDKKTFDVCVNYTNTITQEFLIQSKNPAVEIVPGTDIIYMAVADESGSTVFERVYPIEGFVDNKGVTRHKWTLDLSYLENKGIGAGGYYWDFTYYKDPVMPEGAVKPDGGSFVDTPFCGTAKAHFNVQDIISK